VGWLDNLERDYLYLCACGRESVSDMQSEEVPCAHDDCGLTARFVKMIPTKVGLMSKVSYEQNGRKAYKLQGRNGKVTYISQTKYHYLSTGEVKPHLTSEVERIVAEQDPTYLEGDKNPFRARVKKEVRPVRPQNETSTEARL